MSLLQTIEATLKFVRSNSKYPFILLSFQNTWYSKNLNFKQSLNSNKFHISPKLIFSKAYQGLLQTSNMKHFITIVKKFYLLTIVENHFILNVCGSSGQASSIANFEHGLFTDRFSLFERIQACQYHHSLDHHSCHQKHLFIK